MSLVVSEETPVSYRPVEAVTHPKSMLLIVLYIVLSKGLSADHGVAYARALANFAHNTICQRDGKEVPARLWTSTLRRTRETAQFLIQKKILVKDESGEIGLTSS